MANFRIETLMETYPKDKHKAWYNREVTLDGIPTNNQRINGAYYDKDTAIALGCAIAYQHKVEHQVRDESGKYALANHSNGCPSRK